MIEVIVSTIGVGNIITLVYFIVRLEHRLTKLETVLHELPCRKSNYKGCDV